MDGGWGERGDGVMGHARADYSSSHDDLSSTGGERNLDRQTEGSVTGGGLEGGRRGRGKG